MLTVLDAWGTFPRGVLYGNMYDMGNYDECRGSEKSIDESITIKGKYCFAQPLSSQRINIRIGVCFPTNCSAMQLDMFLREMLQKLLGLNVTQAVVKEENCRVTENNKAQTGLFICTV